jgi:hypothetical protein
VKLRAFIIASVIAMLMCCAAAISITLRHYQHMGGGPIHIFALAGNGNLTDKDALEFSRQTLEMDGRFDAQLTPISFGDNRQVNRGDDPSFCAVGWNNPSSGTTWYVQLHRKDGEVDCVSYPAK